MNAPDIQFIDGIETRAEEIEVFKREFLRYAAMPDLTQPCPLGILVHGRDGEQHRQTVWQVIADEMTSRHEYERRAVELLCRLAQGGTSGYDLGNSAAALLEEMAQSWAESRSEM